MGAEDGITATLPGVEHGYYNSMADNACYIHSAAITHTTACSHNNHAASFHIRWIQHMHIPTQLCQSTQQYLVLPAG